MGERLEEGDMKSKKRKSWSASCHKAPRLGVIHNFAFFMGPVPAVAPAKPHILSMIRWNSLILKPIVIYQIF